VFFFFMINFIVKEVNTGSHNNPQYSDMHAQFMIAHWYASGLLRGLNLRLAWSVDGDLKCRCTKLNGHCWRSLSAKKHLKRALSRPMYCHHRKTCTRTLNISSITGFYSQMLCLNWHLAAHFLAPTNVSQIHTLHLTATSSIQTYKYSMTK